MKLRVIDQPTKTSDLMFDDMYYEAAEDDWRDRAERLQARRWHMLRQAFKRDHASHPKGEVI